MVTERQLLHAIVKLGRIARATTARRACTDWCALALVSDVMMPGIDGLELTRQLREDATTRYLPVILLSARTGEDATSEGLATGANDYIVKPFSARVELHGGQVEAHSAGPGLGSELVIRLLDATEAAGRSAQALGSPSVASRRPARRVLVVDDNRDAADLLAEALRHLGDEVVVAYDGLAALEARATFEPDVALLDIGLPGMDGYELARRLRASAPPSGLRLFALSGYAEARDRVRSKAAGFDEHLAKPVNLRDLCELLANRAPREATA